MKKVYDAIILVFFLAVVIGMFILQESTLELCIAIIATAIFVLSISITAIQNKKYNAAQ